MRTNLVQKSIMMLSIPIILVMGISLLNDMSSGSGYLRVSKILLCIAMIVVLLLVGTFAKILNRGDEI